MTDYANSPIGRPSLVEAEPESADALRTVLAAYPPACQPNRLMPLAGGSGFSGARLWRLDTPRGPACLRRWPAEHPKPDRLEFIQAVLWHVDREGFSLVPVPWETSTHAGYVRHGGHLWEIAPWMPGAADHARVPSPSRLSAAMSALARFHLTAESFPLPSDRHVASPGILERIERLERLRAGGVQAVLTGMKDLQSPELAQRAVQITQLFSRACPRVEGALAGAKAIETRLQPCIRDVWREHVLFVGDDVSGLIDFGAMRPESVAADVARLLGSFVGDDAAGWRAGLDAYQRIRQLSNSELGLVRAFDQSAVLMGGLQWLEWLIVDGRIFPDMAAVLARLDENLARLAQLAGTM